MPIVDILPPSRSQSCYRLRLQHSSGNTYDGFLTYELPVKNVGERTLLLVRGSGDFLETDQQRYEYQRLVERLAAPAGAHLRVTKALVNQLVEGDVRLSNVRIAVHRFGPVPVYVLPFSREHIVDGKRVAITPALYPTVQRPNAEPKDPDSVWRPPELCSRVEFLRSLHIGFDAMIRRYLEDVAECFFDIEHHLNHPPRFGIGRSRSYLAA